VVVDANSNLVLWIRRARLREALLTCVEVGVHALNHMPPRPELSTSSGKPASIAAHHDRIAIAYAGGIVTLNLRSNIKPTLLVSPRFAAVLW